MNTPIYDALLAEQNAASDKFALAKYVADGLGVPLIIENWEPIDLKYFPKTESRWITTTLKVKSPASTWRTFLRCLFWWLP